MWIKKLIIGMSNVFLMFSLVSCSNTDNSNRQVLQNNGEQITVLDNSNKTPINEIKVLNITNLGSIRGMDWLDENNILISKENKNSTPIIVEGEKMYPDNLYLLNLKNNKEKILSPNKYNQGFAMFSPDKKHIFYKKYVEENAQGMIMDVTKGTSKQISNDNNELIAPYNGNWIDNEKILFSNLNGKIRIYDINGNITDIIKSKENNISNINKIGNKIYYISVNKNMYSYDMKSKETKLIKTDVISIVPSSDETQIAIIKKVSSTKMKLFITDLDGNEKVSFSEGTQISGTSWSPDQTKLAYTVTSEDKTASGLLVANVITGKITQLSISAQSTANPLIWSPSGKKILAPIIEIKDSNFEIFTYIFSLK